MPHLGENQVLRDCVFYLYRSREDAEAGVKSGGTGFFVCVDSDAHKKHGVRYGYAVTNHHLVMHGHTVLRVNKRGGGFLVIETDPADWFFKPRSHDIAVAAPELPDECAARHVKLPDYLLSDEVLTEWPIGAGEDLFMIGRFVDYDGHETNEPAMRFGNISVLKANVVRKNKFRGPCIIADVRSRSGFSGSPVFVYSSVGGTLSGPIRPARVRLLGIHFAQFPEYWEIQGGGQADQVSAEVCLQAAGKYVEGLSGMTLVEPAEAIFALLNEQGPRKQRESWDSEHTAHFHSHGYPPVLE